MSAQGEIDIHYFDKEIKFNDVLVIITHPTIGMVSSIVGNYIIDHLNLKLVGAFLSNKFFPTAIIHHGTPLPPVRIYAGEYKDDPSTDFDQIVVIASDLPMEKEIMFPLADRVIEWSKFNNARAVLTIEGINREEMNIGSDALVNHVTSTETAHGFLEGLETNHLKNGMVGGLSGILLFKGKIANFPIISLLADAHQSFPDSRSAVAVLSVLNKLVPGIEIDYAPLLKEAEQIEGNIRTALSQIRQDQDRVRTPPGMYI